MDREPEVFKRTAADVKEKGEPYTTTPRILIGWFGARRRGRWISGQIRQALREAGVTTIPDFETAYIDGEIEIAVPRASEPAHADEPPMQEEVPEVTVDLVTGGSVSDPVARIRMLAAANRVPTSVTRDDRVAEAMTLMLLNDFSQLPVMPNEREVNGMISWRSIGRAGALNRSAMFVRECMEDAVEIRDDAPLLDAIALVAKHGAVLVRQRDRRIVGLVTTSDLTLEFRILAEPFLLIGEIENHLRRLVDGRFSREAVDAAKDGADPERQIEDVADLTFGEYIRLLENPANWSALDIGLDRARLCAQLDRVRRIRNEVMHFSPDGVSDEDLESLRDMVRFLQLV